MTAREVFMKMLSRKPKLVKNLNSEEWATYRCPSCRACVGIKNKDNPAYATQDFCRECGQKIAWENV